MRMDRKPPTRETDGTSACQAGRGGGKCPRIILAPVSTTPQHTCMLPDSYPERKSLWTGSFEVGTSEGSEPLP